MSCHSLLFSEEQCEVLYILVQWYIPRPLQSKTASLWEQCSDSCDVHPLVVSHKRNSKTVWTLIHRWMSLSSSLLSTNLNTAEQRLVCHEYLWGSVSAFSPGDVLRPQSIWTKKMSKIFNFIAIYFKRTNKALIKIITFIHFKTILPQLESDGKISLPRNKK